MVNFSEYFKKCQDIEGKKAMVFCSIDSLLTMNENDGNTQYKILIGFFHIIDEKVFTTVSLKHRLDPSIIKKEAIEIFGEKPSIIDKSQMILALNRLTDSHYRKFLAKQIIGDVLGKIKYQL